MLLSAFTDWEPKRRSCNSNDAPIRGVDDVEDGMGKSFDNLPLTVQGFLREASKSKM